ncbi:glycine oxidase ThiO [Aurantimonas sp. A2-1-M11]|uniref:glycine oxidase ThiO n=1 Tax=Aurantimonas sp. A2-1-M11 TaxID=3113712 RepID=UPI002F920CDF
MRVAVIGAGVAGLVTALELAERGADFDVHEAAPELGLGAASWLAGGMLAPHCEAESADPAIVAPGLAGIAWWARQVPEVVRNGTLVLAPWRDRPDLDRFARRTRGHERLDAEAIAALEPDLSGRFDDGLFFAEEAHLDPRRTLHALAERLRGRGVRLHLGSRVAPADLDHDHIVDTRGIAARPDLPRLRAVRGEMLLLRTQEVSLARPVRLLHPRSPIYVVPRKGGLFMVGATMVETDDDRAITLRGTVELLNAAYALHPAFAEAELVETGSGLRPAYADNLPLVTRQARVVSLNGLYRHGFLLSPAMAGEAVAEIFAEPLRDAS